MLSPQDNELLCTTKPGTPMGELWRRFWIPALLPEEVEADGAPTRLLLLNEELVAWRNTDGSVGIMQNACPHRGASMFFGRNEENGLRCVYHGWKFDNDGQCVDMPNEPAESNFKHKIHATAYPTAEWGGLVWVYMGPSHLKPELPQFEWCLLPPEHRALGKWIQQSNYAQAYEGDLDTSHVSFLHRWFDLKDQPITNRARPGTGGTTLGLSQQDSAPTITVKETDWGLTYGARRLAGDGKYYWRVTQFLLPDWSLIAAPSYPAIGHVWIPRDDHSIWVYLYAWDADKPFPDRVRELYRQGTTGIPRMVLGTHEPFATLQNDYTIDRQLQKTGNYTGIVNGREQDMAVVDSMGPIMDRSKERLGTSDMAIILARRMLLRMARDLQNGKEPYAASHGDAYCIRSLDVVDESPDFGEVLQKYDADVHKPKAIYAGAK